MTSSLENLYNWPDSLLQLYSKLLSHRWRGSFERLPSCVRHTNTCCTIDSLSTYWQLTSISRVHVPASQDKEYCITEVSGHGCILKLNSIWKVSVCHLCTLCICTMPTCETILTLYWLYAPISYEPRFLCSRVFLVPANHERNKHWILTGCHPPLLLFSEGSRLPNPWACLTIPLPPCRTPTLLFWSQGILEEKSLLTSNCYHLSLLL